MSVWNQTRDHCAISHAGQRRRNAADRMLLGDGTRCRSLRPVHDAVLINAPLDRLDAAIASMRAAMAEASRAVLSGFELGTDVHVIRYPDRYMDGRGQVMWRLPLIIAFVILAAFTYTSGLRAPAMIAVVKDTLIYVTVLAMVIVIPIELGGYAKLFA